MKKVVLIAAVAFLLSCNNDSDKTTIDRDSINNNIDNTKTMMDTITNGDTTSYNRMNDRIPSDSMR
jgi:hypothetical protein